MQTFSLNLSIFHSLTLTHNTKEQTKTKKKPNSFFPLFNHQKSKHPKSFSPFDHQKTKHPTTQNILPTTTIQRFNHQNNKIQKLKRFSFEDSSSFSFFLSSYFSSSFFNWGALIYSLSESLYIILKTTKLTFIKKKRPLN